jgi:hypothetical protein
MHNIETIIPAIEAFADRHGVLPATVVRKATGNPRLYDRLKSRAERLDEDIGRIAKFLVENDQGEALPDGVPPVAVDDTSTMGNGDSPESRTGAA